VPSVSLTVWDSVSSHLTLGIMLGHRHFDANHHFLYFVGLQRNARQSHRGIHQRA